MVEVSLHPAGKRTSKNRKLNQNKTEEPAVQNESQQNLLDNKTFKALRPFQPASRCLKAISLWQAPILRPGFPSFLWMGCLKYVCSVYISHVFLIITVCFSLSKTYGNSLYSQQKLLTLLIPCPHKCAASAGSTQDPFGSPQHRNCRVSQVLTKHFDLKTR